MGEKPFDYTPQYLRGRAEQTRTMAKATLCGATVEMLEKRAAEYDRLADLQESSHSGVRVLDTIQVWPDLAG